SLENYSL
ncbi:hypothetical protein CP8484711_0621B, partial [Chlamydia psittaci 84-8471/1]